MTSFFNCIVAMSTSMSFRRFVKKLPTVNFGTERTSFAAKLALLQPRTSMWTTLVPEWASVICLKLISFSGLRVAPSSTAWP